MCAHDETGTQLQMRDAAESTGFLQDLRDRGYLQASCGHLFLSATGVRVH